MSAAYNVAGGLCEAKAVLSAQRHGGVQNNLCRYFVFNLFFIA